MNKYEIRRARLRHWLDENYDGNVSAFVRTTGRSQSLISQVLKGGRGFGERLARQLEKEMMVPDGWLDQAPEGTPVADDEVPEHYVPVRRGTLRLSCGVAGFAIEHDDGERQPLFFRREWFVSRGFDPERLLALRVMGASMEPGLFDGDTVVVNLADPNPIDGEAFAVNYEGELVIKRLRRDAGEWWLTSDNSDKRRFPDKRCSGDGVQILGRIVYKSSERI